MSEIDISGEVDMRYPGECFGNMKYLNGTLRSNCIQSMEQRLSILEGQFDYLEIKQQELIKENKRLKKRMLKLNKKKHKK